MIQVTKFDETGSLMPDTAELRGHVSNIVQLPAPNEAARLRQAAFHREEFADCIHMALAGLLGLALMLTASALLRGASVQGEIAQYLQSAFRILAAAGIISSLVALCLALVHLSQFRQV